MEVVEAFAVWLWENRVGVFTFSIIFFNRKSLWKYFVRDPLTGGNGHTHPDELAKWLLMVSFIAMLGTYKIMQWPMSLFAMILLSVVAIAKLDTVVEIIGKAVSNFNKGKQDKE